MDQNADVTTAAQCTLNTAKSIRWDMDSCNRDYKDVVKRKGYSRHSYLYIRQTFLSQAMFVLLIQLFPNDHCKGYKMGYRQLQQRLQRSGQQEGATGILTVSTHHIFDDCINLLETMIKSWLERSAA